MYGMRKNDATLNQSILVCYHSVSLYRTERLVQRREPIRSTALSTVGTFSGIKSTWQGESSVISIASVSTHPTLTHRHTLSTPIHSIVYPASANLLCHPRISQNFTLGETYHRPTCSARFTYESYPFPFSSILPADLSHLVSASDSISLVPLDVKRLPLLQPPATSFDDDRRLVQLSRETSLIKIPRVIADSGPYSTSQLLISSCGKPRHESRPI